ncbi:MAG: FAD/NAD(P)-binding protein [Leucobacter sp.]
MTTSQPGFPASIALIGAGPRGASLLERFAAHLSTRGEVTPLTIHVVDDAETGAGRVWRTDQTRELCMNTLSDAVTLFTEPGSTVSGPIVPGPTLYEWSLLALAELEAAALGSAEPSRGDLDADHGSDSYEGINLAGRVAAIPMSRRKAFHDAPVREGFASEFRDELRATVPESHPSRALYGEYLAWCYKRAVRSLPDSIEVVRHHTRAVGVSRIAASDRTGGRERVTLESGAQLIVDSVVLATGWLPRALTTAEQHLTHDLADRPELTWVQPGSPVEQELNAVAANTDVIVRGLGMGFFDTMALLTAGRGGEFVRDASTRGGLRYLPSGREPRIHAASGRGVPFRAKTLYRSLPPRSAQRYLRAVDWSREPKPLNFDRQFWPRIVADAFFDHADTLARVRPEAITDLEALIAELERTLEGLLARTTVPAVAEVPWVFETALAPFFRDPADHFPLSRELDPAGAGFATAESFQHWIYDRVVEDLTEGALGRDSALKAGLWSISSARGFTSRIGTFGGFDAESRSSGIATLFAVGGMVGSGPPAFRNQQLLALVDAGLLRFIGPRVSVAVGSEGFIATSSEVSGSRVVAPTLIDAWMHSTDVRATTDLLTRTLIDSGRARTFVVASRRGESGTPYETRSFDIDEATGLLIGTDGTLDPAIHAAGIPVDDTVHDTIISPMPGTDPTMLRETDRIAASALRIAYAKGARVEDAA